jgi:hypothetical protein
VRRTGYGAHKISRERGRTWRSQSLGGRVLLFSTLPRNYYSRSWAGNYSLPKCDAIGTDEGSREPHLKPTS